MSSNEKKISVIIPVYNTGHYLDKCINSIINQSFNNLEIIIIDDGSTDDSYKKCTELAKLDNRIKIYSKKNEGLGYTRNFGLSRASGDYISFIDSDDYIELDFYEKLYKKLIKENADAVFSNMKLVDSNNIVYFTETIPFKSDTIDANQLIKSLLKIKDKNDYGKKYFGMSAVRALYKKKIIDDNKIYFKSEREYVSEDILFNIEYCLKSSIISFVSDTYYYYYYNQNSLTHTYRDDRFIKSKKLINEMNNLLKPNKNYNIYLYGLNSILLDYVRFCIKQEIIYNKGIILKNNIKMIISDKDVIDALKNDYNSRLSQRLFNFILLLKDIRLIIIIYKIKNRLEK